MTDDDLIAILEPNPGTAARARTASPAARQAHRAILRQFATTGTTPDTAQFAAETMAELHERDLVRIDGDGAITVAYPFSATPTPHRVHIADGARAWSMCAIDALGIAAMLDRDIAIDSTDPHTGQAIHVEIHNGLATWSPDTTVVFVGVRDCCRPGDPSVDSCCGVLNFFATSANATAWHADHPGVTGQAVDQATALRLGTEIFGPLLAS